MTYPATYPSFSKVTIYRYECPRNVWDWLIERLRMDGKHTYAIILIPGLPIWNEYLEKIKL